MRKGSEQGTLESPIDFYQVEVALPQPKMLQPASQTDGHRSFEREINIEIEILMGIEFCI